MSELISNLINLINQEKTINEIADTLKLSNKQIYNLITTIRNKGFDFNRKYYYNGDIVYVPRKSLLTNSNNEVNIITSPEDQVFTALVISDLHIGNELERIDLLNKVYDYCIKEGIHVIINTGDLIDGTFGQGNKKHDNVIEQIDYALQMYPFDKNILNFTLLGNHDFSSLTKTGQDLAIILNSYRHDIIPIGYKLGKINIKNDSIILKHPLENITPEPDSFNKQLILKGHNHKMKLITGNNCILYIPSLSNINTTEENIMPSAIKLTLNFNNGLFKEGTIKQLIFEDKTYVLNELPFYLKKSETDNKKIELEESHTKKLIKQEQKYTPNMSQIEKFNVRYQLK